MRMYSMIKQCMSSKTGPWIDHPDSLYPNPEGVLVVVSEYAGN